MSELKEGTSVSVEESTIDFNQRSETAALVENKCFVKLSKHLPNISTKEINSSLNGCSSSTYGTFESTNSCSPGTDEFCKNDSNSNDNILITDSTSNHSGGHNMNTASPPSSSGELPLEPTSSLSNGISPASGETDDTTEENGCTETVQAGPNPTSTLPEQSVLDPANTHIEYKPYESEIQMQAIMTLIQKELSEPYSIYTYRYFIHKWPELCFLAAHMNEYVGAIVCKLDFHANVNRGYIAMLAVKEEYRKMKIGTNLVTKAIEAMLAGNAAEVVLETEARNKAALRLYENLGFVRDRRLFRYYLNGFDAIRLKLWFK